MSELIWGSLDIRSDHQCILVRCRCERLELLEEGLVVDIMCTVAGEDHADHAIDAVDRAVAQVDGFVGGAQSTKFIRIVRVSSASITGCRWSSLLSNRLSTLDCWNRNALTDGSPFTCNRCYGMPKSPLRARLEAGKGGSPGPAARWSGSPIPREFLTKTVDNSREDIQCVDPAHGFCRVVVRQFPSGPARLPHINLAAGYKPRGIRPRIFPWPGGPPSPVPGCRPCRTRAFRRRFPRCRFHTIPVRRETAAGRSRCDVNARGRQRTARR